MWIRVKFFTISCISSNLNRVEKQLLPVGKGRGGDGKWSAETRKAKGTAARATLTVLTHVVDRQDGGPAGGTGAVEGHVDHAVRGLDAVLLEGETLVSRSSA